MKKLFILFAILMISAFAVQSQIAVFTLANQSKGVDSVSIAGTTYFYLNGTSGTQNSIVTPHGTKAGGPITQYSIQALVCGSTANVTNTDSTYFQWQVSLDNVNWMILPELPDYYVVSGGTHAVTTPVYQWAAHGHAAGESNFGYYTFTTNPCFPYVRLKTVGTSTARTYITAYALLKKL
jgi:hypothetical protein